MRTFTPIAAFAIIVTAASSALAQSPSSPLTREQFAAQEQAERDTMAKKGYVWNQLYTRWDYIGRAPETQPAPRTREAVMAELKAWRQAPADTDGWKDIGGEPGSVFVGTASATSRAAVRAELEAFQRDPVSSDGWAYVGGEAGFAYPARRPVTTASGVGRRAEVVAPARAGR